MDQNKLRKLAGLPVIVENLRNNANFQSRMLEKFENAKDHFEEIRKFINSADFDKFLELYNEENYNFNSSMVDTAGNLAEHLENAEAIMGTLYQVCSKVNSASS